MHLSVNNINSWLENKGLSAIGTNIQPNQHPGEQFNIDNLVLSQQQEGIRENFLLSALSDARGIKPADVNI